MSQKLIEDPLIKQRPKAPFALLIYVGICVGLTLFFFSPRLWLMREYTPGTYQWDRARTYLMQCESPFRRDVEPAMLWRLLPPLASRSLGLTGLKPLAIPLIGLVTFSVYVAVILRRRCPDPRFIMGGTLLVITTSAGLVPLHWLGLNDAWVWLGLLAVSFGRTEWAVPVACILCPWIDERFIIGTPLAFLVRCTFLKIKPEARAFFWIFLWLTPYASLRLVFSADPTVANATSSFVASHVNQISATLPFAPLGWWMGLRLAWLPLLYALRLHRWNLRLTAALTAGISLVLAADISRSIAILVPIALLGILEITEVYKHTAIRGVFLAGILSLAIPSAHVVYTKIDVISPLPVEIYRLIKTSRGPGH